MWRRQWHPTPVLLPGKSHGRRSIVGYNPWGHKESDTTEQLCFTSLPLSLAWVGLYVHAHLIKNTMGIFFSEESKERKELCDKAIDGL